MSRNVYQNSFISTGHVDVNYPLPILSRSESAIVRDCCHLVFVKKTFLFECCLSLYLKQITLFHFYKCKQNVFLLYLMNKTVILLHYILCSAFTPLYYIEPRKCTSKLGQFTLAKSAVCYFRNYLYSQPGCCMCCQIVSVCSMFVFDRVSDTQNNLISRPPSIYYSYIQNNLE